MFHMLAADADAHMHERHKLLCLHFVFTAEKKNNEQIAINTYKATYTND